MSPQKTIHFTELPPAPGDREWETYRREVGRLLAEGNDGRWVLIQGDQIVGVYPTEEEVSEVGARRFLLQPYLKHQIRTEEPVSFHLGFYLASAQRSCPT